MDVDVPAAADADTEVDERFGALFAEELGLVLEVSSADAETVVAAFEKENVPVTRLGGVTAEKEVKVKVAGVTQVEVRNLFAFPFPFRWVFGSRMCLGRGSGGTADKEIRVKVAGLTQVEVSRKRPFYLFFCLSVACFPRGLCL